MTKNDSPCLTCERKGCGSYHDECEPYRKYKEKLANEKVIFQPKGRSYIKDTTYRSRVHHKKKG